MASSPPPSTSASPWSPSSSTSSSPETNTNQTHEAALPRMKALLRQILRITTTDGRIFLGTFAGTDKPLNIILVNVDEYRIGQQGDGRYVGQVMFPWKMVVKVEAYMKEETSRSNRGYYERNIYS